MAEVATQLEQAQQALTLMRDQVETELQKQYPAITPFNKVVALLEGIVNYLTFEAEEKGR